MGSLSFSWTRLALLTAGASMIAAVPLHDAHARPIMCMEEPAPGGQAGGGVSIGGSAGADTSGDKSADANAEGEGAANAPTPAAAPAKNEPAPKGKKTTKKGWGVEDLDKKPLFRHAPERNTWELGVFGGMFFAHEDHDFYNPSTAPQKQLWLISPEFGVRVGYMPLTFLGVEAEFSAIPTFVRDDNNTFVFLYGFRGSALLQAPGTRIAPFLLGGYGAFGTASDDRFGVGNDLDPVGHIGVGAKVFINRYMAFRLDGRQYIGAEAARQGDTAFHYAITAGLSFTLGRAKRVPGDMDKDGFLDAVDECPMAPGIAPHGCPARDLDGDTIMDHEDQCPCDPGPAPTGCPTDKDTDGDGFPDPADSCPNEPGIAPDGCPVRDTDGDGYPDRVDKCPTVPETFNGYLDEDGCKDEIPKEIEEFEGTVEGITFDFNKDTIRPSSEPVLDKAVSVFKKFTDIRVRVEGHTDNVGDPVYNQELSEKRAAAVKQYMVDKGIDAGRIETAGFGDKKPIDPADTKAARAKNRRIEFHVIKTAGPAKKP